MSQTPQPAAERRSRDARFAPQSTRGTATVTPNVARSPRERIAELQRLAGNAATARLLMRMNGGSKSWADWRDEDSAGQSEPEPPEELRFTLELPDHFTFGLACDADNSVKDLKDFVASETLADRTTIVVFLGGHPLDDGEELVADGAYAVTYDERAPGMQRKRDEEQREATHFELDDEVERVLANARYVNQDNAELAADLGEEGSLLYYIGKELAYTYNLKTCSAITIYCASTKLAFLDHIDADADPEQISSQVAEYLKQVCEERGAKAVKDFVKDLRVVIYYARGEEKYDDGSLALARKSLERAGVKAEVEKTVTGVDLIVVGDEQPARVVTKDRDNPLATLTHVRYAMRAYVRGQDDVETTTARGDLLSAWLVASGKYRHA